MSQTQITAKNQLLVEGNDTKNFMQALIKHLDIDSRAIQIQNFGGIDDLKGFLPIFVKSPRFHIVNKIGIVRDAELDAAKAFDSVRSALRKAELPVPTEAGKPSGDSPEVAVLILPDNENSGMLETLLCQSIAGTPEDTCITEFFECIPNEIPEHRQPKARARAWIATQVKPQVSVGVAAKKGFWNLDHMAFHPIIELLKSISGTIADNRSTSNSLEM